ncbi:MULTISPECIES: ATP-grasp domain-containing protein [Cupriavidus]
MQLLMPQRVILQRYARGLGAEERMVADAAAARGIAVRAAGVSELQRNRVMVGAGDVVIGSLPFVLQGMRHAGILVPEPNPYPVSLRPWLHRKVKRLPMLRDALHELEQGRGACFVKPADRWKRFTGFVASDPADLRFQGTSKRSPVWVSTPVRFLSEWRCYVAHGEIRAIALANYGGDPSVLPDEGAMRQACAALQASGEAPAGYVIDFGVLDTGETALIELNDGFSFGAYGNVTGDVLLDVMSARWLQLAEVARCAATPVGQGI